MKTDRFKFSSIIASSAIGTFIIFLAHRNGYINSSQTIIALTVFGILNGVAHAVTFNERP